MKTLLLSLIISLNFGIISLMAQIDYNYNQVNRVSTQHPTEKIMWLKSAQSKQSVSFDHLIFFVKESNNDDITGDNVILNVYRNKKLIHTKEFTTMSKAPNSIFLLSPISLKRKKSVYLTITLKPNPNNSPVSYMISIKDRTTFLRDDPEQYREMVKYETPSHSTITTQTKSQNPLPKGMFGETYDPNKPRKKKRSGNNGWINVVGFLAGM